MSGPGYLWSTHSKMDPFLSSEVEFLLGQKEINLAEIEALKAYK